MKKALATMFLAAVVLGLLTMINYPLFMPANGRDCYRNCGWPYGWLARYAYTTVYGDGGGPGKWYIVNKAALVAATTLSLIVSVVLVVSAAVVRNTVGRPNNNKTT